jgi:hypothetical protein
MNCALLIIISVIMVVLGETSNFRGGTRYNKFENQTLISLAKHGERNNISSQGRTHTQMLLAQVPPLLN